MNETHSPDSVGARLSLALLEIDLRRANAEQMTRFTLDDLTEAREQLDASRERCTELSKNLEASCEEATVKRIRLDKLAAEMGCARDLIREGRVADGLKLLGDLIALAGSR